MRLKCEKEVKLVKRSCRVQGTTTDHAIVLNVKATVVIDERDDIQLLRRCRKYILTPLFEFLFSQWLYLLLKALRCGTRASVALCQGDFTIHPIVAPDLCGLGSLGEKPRNTSHGHEIM